VATFAGCKINTSGNYELTAVDVTDGLQVNSSSLTITVGAASQIGFVQQPSGATASGTVFPTQPKVAIEDAAGNTVTTASATITLALGSGSTGTLSGCTSTMTGGVATFSACKVTGTVDILNDTLKATATSGFSGTATSSSFNVTAAATKLAYVSQPTVVSNGNLSTFQVKIEDAASNVVTSASGTVALAISSGPSGAVLTCNGSTSPTATVSYGVATFTGCGVSKSSATAYTLTATDSALTTPTVVSSSFIVSSISAPTIAYPASTNQINPGVGGTGTFAIIGTNFVNGTALTISSNATVNATSWINANILILNVTGTGSTGATSNVTITNPDGGTVTSNNGFVNG